MKSLLPAFKALIAVAAIGATGYLLYTQAAPLLAAPCSSPIEYSIGSYDPKFGVSESQFKVALAAAASVWNEEAGKTLVEAAPLGESGIPVNLVYSEVQKATELGKNIDAEQEAYDDKKADVNALRDRFSSAKSSYERASAAYDAKAKAYQEQVSYWNAQGGAPPAEYQKLNAQGKALEAERRDLNADADEVNSLAKDINTAVGELNALARKINAKVSTYNASAGEDFDQGNYEADKEGKRINIYEFKNTEDLERVLVHEFGHALGLGHVENPDSIMYSFNIGEGLDLTEEDIAELGHACKLDTKASSGQD